MSDNESGDEKGMDDVGIVVDYCPTCTLPPDFCEFGPCFEACKPWLMENYPDVYPDLVKDMENLEISDKPKDEAKGDDEDESSSSSKGKKGKKAKGQKKVGFEKPAQQCVILFKDTRRKKKVVTIIQGLIELGLKPKKASSTLRKRFACGVTVTDGEIVLQGDMLLDLAEFVQENWNIPHELIFYKPASGRKVPAFSSDGDVNMPPM